MQDIYTDIDKLSLHITSDSVLCNKDECLERGAFHCYRPADMARPTRFRPVEGRGCFALSGGIVKARLYRRIPGSLYVSCSNKDLPLDYQFDASIKHRD
jgi:hypothetical protein